MFNNVYDFPMSLEEAEIIHDSLLELKNTYYVGYREHFNTEKKELIDNLIDNLGTWIDNRKEN